MTEPEDKSRNNTNENEEEKEDIDSILAKTVGQFGLHQFRTTMVVIIFIALCGMQSDTVIITARINTRCFVPECERDIDNAQFRPSWISTAIPRNPDGTYDNCHRYALNATNSNTTEICSSQEFDQRELIECDSYVYENHETVVYDFNLGCKEWSRAFIGTVECSAYFISILLAGYISDRWGRRIAFSFNVVCVTVFGLSRYWTNSLTTFLIFTFIKAIFACGYYPSGFILVMEAVGPKYRVLLGAIISCSLSVGQLLTGAIAWFIPQWRSLTLTIYPPAILIIFFWNWYRDSPKWYVSKNRFDEAVNSLKDMASINKKEISEHILNKMKKVADEELRLQTLQKEEMLHEPCLPVLVFRHKPVLIRCIVTPIWWFSFILIYYSYGYNSFYLSGNKYVSYMSNYAIDIPAFFSCIFILDRFGRKAVLFGSCLLGAIFQIAYIFAPKDNFGVQLTLYLCGKMCSAAMVATGYLYTAELYPTKYRHQLFAFSSFIGRFGSLIAPLTPAMGEVIPYILYASLSLLTGFLALFVPETMGCKLPDTLEECSNMMPMKEKLQLDNIKKPEQVNKY